MITLTTAPAPDMCHHPDASPAPATGDHNEQPDEEELALLRVDMRRGLPDLTVTDAPPVPPLDTPFCALIVANDHALRHAITVRLQHIGAGTIHNATTVTEARASALTISPGDIAVIDFEMVNDAGVELVSELHDRGWLHIIVLAATTNPHAIPLTFHAGADAYLLKSPQPATNTASINPNTNPYDTLSGREITILNLVADGLSNKEIAEKLHLSAFTIKTHLHRISRKLGTGNRAHITTLALRAGIIR